ncbi:thiamine-phosphate kinase [Helicobacter sp. 23-1045]
MDREAKFIANLQAQKITRFIGDDGAVVGKKVYAMDLFCEGVHFKIPHFSYYQIAQKALLVNISDILAMGAKPKYTLLGISLGESMSGADIDELNKGFSAVCRSFDIKIIGGDTITSSELNIAITMIGEVRKKPILRSGFRVGDLLFHTQTRGNPLGRAIKDMRYLYRGGKIARGSKFYAPQLHAKFISDILGFVRGGMDISDGLFNELNRISALNRVGFKFCQRVNRANAVSGEEYEFLFSIRKSDERKLRLIAQKNRVNLVKVANLVRGKARFHCISWHK